MSDVIIKKKKKVEDFRTEAHLAPYETAARIYCQKIGLDPDDVRPIPHPGGLAIMVERPIWCFAAEELIDLSFKLSAIKEASEAKKH